MDNGDVDYPKTTDAEQGTAEAEIVRLANAVVATYTAERLAEAARHQENCGCRSCVAAGNRWLAWAAGDDEALYERLRYRFKGEVTGPV